MITVKDKYKENEALIQRYTDFLLNHNYYASDQNSTRVKKVTREGENKLIEEIARLRFQNKQIRVTAIVTPNYLNNEYHEYTIATNSKINSTYFFAPYPTAVGSTSTNMELR